MNAALVLIVLVLAAAVVVLVARRHPTRTDPAALTQLLEANRAVMETERERAAAELEGKRGLIDSRLDAMSTELGRVTDLVKEFEDRYGQFGAFGLTTYPATQVVLEAVKKACDEGSSTPDVDAVAENVKNTNIQESVLGQPIEFESNGEMKDARFYVYTIKDGKYEIAPS